MNIEDVQSIAFEIISYAGDAYGHFYEAINKASEGLIEEANNEIKEGEIVLTNAHKAQMDMIVKEASNEKIDYSLIMVHAQDHLTMAIFAKNMAEQFVKVWEKVNER